MIHTILNNGQHYVNTVDGFFFRMEDQVLDESMDYGRYSMSIKFWVAVVVVLASILVYVLKKKLTRCNTVLIVGLSDSGKTVMFSKLVNPSKSAFFCSLVRVCFCPHLLFNALNYFCQCFATLL